MSMKRGQVTIFIIIGLFLTFGALIYFLLLQPQVKASQDVAQFAPIEQFLQSCFKTKAEESLLMLTHQGGYRDPQDYVSYSSYHLPLYATSQATTYPTLQDISQQLAQETSRKFKICLEQLSTFNQQGFEIDAVPEIPVQVYLGDRIKLLAQTQISASKGNQEKEFGTFDIILHFNLPEAHRAVELFMNKYNKDRTIPLSYIIDLSRSEYIDFSMIDFTNYTIITLFFLQKGELPEVPFSWAIAHNFVPRELSIIPLHVLEVPLLQPYQIQVEGGIPPYNFVTDVDYVSIDVLGNIDIETTLVPEGSSSALITVHDSQGWSDQTILTLEKT